jgi:hypothetical protein
MIRDSLLMFTAAGTSGYSPTSTGDNVGAANTYDTAPLGLPTGSGGAAATGYNAGSSTNAGRDLGIGGEMWFYVLVTATVTSTGSATVKFDFVTDSSATLANVVDSTGVGVLMSSAVFPKATLIAGFRFAAQLPASLVYLEYIGLDVVIATQTLSAGTFESGLVMNIQESDLYLSGFAVQ